VKRCVFSLESDACGNFEAIFSHCGKPRDLPIFERLAASDEMDLRHDRFQTPVADCNKETRAPYLH